MGTMLLKKSTNKHVNEEAESNYDAENLDAELSPNTQKVMYIRVPLSIAHRIKRQSTRLACSMNVLARMAIIKFLEEEERNENNK